jgi:hypothetical protein
MSFWTNPYAENPRRRQKRRRATAAQVRARELRRGCTVTYRPTAGGLVEVFASCPRRRISNQGERYYVSELWRGRLEHTVGPYDLQTARLYGRISATEGKHDRVVTRGLDGPIVRRYEAGSGESLFG